MPSRPPAASGLDRDVASRATCPGAALAALLLATPFLVSSSIDRGVILEVDRATFSLQAIDVAHDVRGPELRVALGSPAHPTPTGVFPIRHVIRNPGWTPGRFARAAGARRHEPSTEGPLGIAKIPFEHDAIAIHGGAHRFAPGAPVTLGCVTTLDEDMVVLLEWLETRRALHPGFTLPDGEIRQSAARPVRIVVR